MSNPINILQYGGNTVRFRVEQTCKDGEIGWISVAYDPADGINGKVCLSSDGVDSASSTPDYNAKCENGVSKVDVYVYEIGRAHV